MDNKQRRSDYFRRRSQCPAFMPSMAEISDWLSDGDFDSSIYLKSIQIVPIPEPPKRFKRLNRVFKAAFQESQTKHHGYLKWFAWNKIVQDNDASRFEEGDVFYERDVHVPLPDESFQGRVLPRGHFYRGKAGNFLKVDVGSEYDKVVIECGVTTGNNLTLPLRSWAVNKIIWIPFPYKDVNSDWPDFNRTIEAYLIRRQSIIK